MNGLALTILVGQLPKLFGFSVDGDGFIADVAASSSGVADGETVAAALAVGVVGAGPDPRPAAAAARGSRRARRGRPVDRARRALFDLADHGVDLVGTLPQGFPPLTVPAVPLADLALLFAGAARHRAGVPHRHDLDRVRVRRPDRRRRSTATGR